MNNRNKKRSEKDLGVTVVVEPSIKSGSKSRKEKLSNYLIDISKYALTGVVIASLFQDLDENRPLIYVLGLFITFTALGVGLVLTDKKKGE